MASKRRLRRKKCTSKRKYDDKQLAIAAVRALKTKDYLKGRRLTAYKCSFCKQWHIGHNKKNSSYRSRRQW